MDESNWWLYLLGAVVAYMVIPWRAVFKWLLVAFLAAMAFAMATDSSSQPTYRIVGGIFFAALAIATARSQYREEDSMVPRKNSNGNFPKPESKCCKCNGSGTIDCFCSVRRDKADIFGGRCAECNDTKRKTCYVCYGTGK